MLSNSVISDHLNNMLAVIDQNGQTIWSAKYDPFGKATVTGNIKYNLRAEGQYQDDETGLYYNWYRYYSPDLGRYITSDPIGLAGGINTYIYVNGNPINYTDPQGLIAPILIGAGWGFVAGGGTELGIQMLQHGGNFSSYDLGGIGRAGIAGAVTGGIGGFVGQKALSAFMSMGVDVAINGASANCYKLL